MTVNLVPRVGPAEPPGSARQSSSVTAASAAVAVSGPSMPAEAASGLAAVPTDAELDGVQLDASKLHCYQVALELHTQWSVLVSVLNRVVRDQLERASLSVLLNTAEGAGRRDKARYFAYARGSATEVAALLDVLDRRRLASPAAIRTSRRLAIRAIQMLTRVHQKISA